MSAKFIRILALAGLTVVAGAAASTITLDGAYAQAAKGGGLAGGGGGGGGGNQPGGRGGNGGGGDKTDRSSPEALPIFAVNPNCLAAYCRPWIPPRRKPVRPARKIQEDNCGGYKPLEKSSDPLIYDPNFHCEYQPS